MKSRIAGPGTASKPKGGSAQSASASVSGHVVGRSNFGKISEIEGLTLTPAMKRRAAAAKEQGLSAEEYRNTIIRGYRKG